MDEDGTAHLVETLLTSPPPQRGSEPPLGIRDRTFEDQDVEDFDGVAAGTVENEHACSQGLSGRARSSRMIPRASEIVRGSGSREGSGDAAMNGGRYVL